MQQAKNFEKEEKATARICILEELPNQALMMRKITQNVENLSMQKTGNHQNFEQQEAPESAKRESRMYLGIQHQQDSLKISFLGSSPLWLPSYTHFPLFLLLCLGIYCFKLNFKTIVQLSIPSLEKSIFRAPLVTKIQILINSLPFSSRHAFSLFYLIFNRFSRFYSIFLSMNKLHNSKSWNLWNQLMRD